MTRRKARELVMQMLYEGNFHGEEERERILYDKISEMTSKEKSGNKPMIKFIEEIYFGIYTNLEDIDAKIASVADNWSMSRMAKVDLSILRLAVYELTFTDVPTKVAVNEAVEIAKEFSTDKSPKFIHGVLGKITQSNQS